MTKEKFTEALNKSAFDFREDHINGLIQDAPKGFKDEIQYRDMFFFIKVSLLHCGLASQDTIIIERQATRTEVNCSETPRASSDGIH